MLIHSFMLEVFGVSYPKPKTELKVALEKIKDNLPQLNNVVKLC